MILYAGFNLPTPSRQSRSSGLTLVEVLVSFAVLGLTSGGLLMGYVQINRLAEWSSMSLAAQSVAQQGYEQVKSAAWNFGPASNATNWPNQDDQLGFPASLGYTNITTTSTLHVPSTGVAMVVTNFISITNINSLNPPLRQIRSDCVWTFPSTQQIFTNTVISLRAPDA